MLVTKALTLRASSMGDCLMGKYLLDNIHAQFPEAKLGLMVSSRGAMIRELLASAPYIEVIEVNRRDLRGLFALWKSYRKSDLVVTQYAGKKGGSFSLASKWFARLLAKRGGLVGFVDASGWNRFLYDHLVGGVLGEAPAVLERKALEAAGLSVPIARPTLTTSATSSVMSKYNLQPRGYIVAHLFAGNRGRGLRPDKRRELLVALCDALSVPVVMTGGVGDIIEAREDAKGLTVVNLVGATTVEETATLMAHSRGVVSVDTGGAHIAAQLHKPLIVLATCLGLHWWKESQYGAQAPITLMTHTEAGPHVFKDYPDCINRVSMHAVASSARQHFV